jgi:stage II sporulation protein D
MKTVYIITMMALSALMLLIPLASKNNLESLPASVIVEEERTPEEKVKVLMSATSKIVEYSVEDYIFGVVAAEMPALYEEEALKAQAVAAYTYYLVQKEENRDKDYDITDDYTINQAFIPPEKAREKWGDGAEKYEAKIRGAVKLVLGKRVTYGGKNATTLYHAISFGVTEKASEVWGGDYPYLISVDSSFDKLNENYLVTTTIDAKGVKEKLSSLVEIKDASANCFGQITRTEAGGVKTVIVSGKELSGVDVRRALGLRSANFEVSFKDGKYSFATKGYGHSIGMSQYGAHYMAMQGKNFEEILLHYYSGCKIE